MKVVWFAPTGDVSGRVWLTPQKFWWLTAGLAASLPDNFQGVQEQHVFVFHLGMGPKLQVNHVERDPTKIPCETPSISRKTWLVASTHPLFLRTVQAPHLNIACLENTKRMLRGPWQLSLWGPARDLKIWCFLKSWSPSHHGFQY